MHWQQSSWNKIFLWMVNWLNSPMGWNILAEIFSNNRFVVGSFFACLWRSTKSKTNWSVAVFQSEPNTFTIAFSEAWSAASKGLLVVFAYDSSSSVTIFLTLVTTAGFTQSSAQLIASCTILEFVFQFLKLNPPCWITDLGFMYKSKSIVFTSFSPPVTRSSIYR